MDRADASRIKEVVIGRKSGEEKEKERERERQQRDRQEEEC